MEWAWFFDIDGTLVEIVDSPWRVIVDDDLKLLVAQLHFLTGEAVALITGRSIESVDKLMPFEGMPIAGQHGLELRSAPGEILTQPVLAESLDCVRRQLADAVARHPGLLLEYKGLSLALHYRHAPALAGYAHRLVRSLRDQYVPDFMIQKGKRIVELKPAGKDKGVAIIEFMNQPPFAGRKPVFIGDDVTDEIGFQVVNEMGGLSIKIGGGRTEAICRLRDVPSLRKWLKAGVDAALVRNNGLAPVRA